jgi:mono/diheme cytochrome c family protein/plastocyanin
MTRRELASRILIMAAAVGAVGTSLYFWARTPLIHARVAENGGWTPDVLRAKVGEPLRLRLTSDDVVHGFAVGRMDMESVDVMPGKVTDVMLSFDKPGTYTFYCTRWCGLNHWRVRGTIEVSGPESGVQTSTETAAGKVIVPLFVTLGLNIDSPHESPLIPGVRPSAIRGEQLASHLPVSKFIDPDFYRAHSPFQTWRELRSTFNRSNLNDQQIWDLVAFIWRSGTKPADVATGRKLFGQNCAACHGGNGAGNGIYAEKLAAAGKSSMQTMTGAKNMRKQAPANLADPKRMLGASPALLQGKILRGGMGTGMPSWGPIFTQKQTWDLIAFLYSFQFQYHELRRPDGQETEKAEQAE